jgi:hypothetical protein
MGLRGPFFQTKPCIEMIFAKYAFAGVALQLLWPEVLQAPPLSQQIVAVIQALYKDVKSGLECEADLVQACRRLYRHLQQLQASSFCGSLAILDLFSKFFLLPDFHEFHHISPKNPGASGSRSG